MALDEDLPMLVTLARLQEAGNERARDVLREKLRGRKKKTEELAKLLCEEGSSASQLDPALTEQVRAIKQLAGVAG